MNFLQDPDAINAPNLQVWNNAAFDKAETEEPALAIASSSWSPLQSISLKRSDSFDLNSCKENQSPEFRESPVKPICAIGKPLKLLFKQGLLGSFPKISNNEEKASRDEGEIDTEIEESEREIIRLAGKLEELRLEKAEKVLKKIESSENTIESTQSRRKSRSWKIRGIDEGKVTKQRGGRNLSPMRGLLGFSTVGSKKAHVKNENGVLTSIQPKKLFKEGEKTGEFRKPGRRRVVASRYNQIPVQFGGNSRLIDQRKREFSENEKEEMKKCEKRSASLAAKFYGVVGED